MYNNMKNDEYIKEFSRIISSTCYRYYPTFNHNDLFNQGVIIALENKHKLDSLDYKPSTFLVGAIRGGLDKYIKKNMIQISVPHNVTPDWNFGSFEMMPDIYNEEEYDRESYKERITRELNEEIRINKVKKSFNKEHQQIIDLVLQGYALHDISSIMGKSYRQWAGQTLKRIIKKIERNKQ